MVRTMRFYRQNRWCALGLFVVLMLLHPSLRAETDTEQSMTNLEIIKSTYEGDTAQENAVNLQRYVVDDVVWKEADGFPYAGTYIGFDQIAQQVFQRLAAEWIDYRFTVEGYLADGDQVVSYGTYSGQHRATGRHFTARVAHLWTLREGKIIRFEQFVDSLPVVDAMDRSNTPRTHQDD